MAGIKPIRRVVTGNDERGKSKVVWDGPAPNAHATSMGVARGHTDLWIWNETPAPLSETSDPGNGSYVFPGPDEGGHLRVVEGRPSPPATIRRRTRRRSRRTRPAASGCDPRLGPRRRQPFLLGIP